MAENGGQTPETDEKRRQQLSVRKLPSLETVKQIKETANRHLHYTANKDRNVATSYDYYTALSATVREKLSGMWIKTQQEYYRKDPKVCSFVLSISGLQSVNFRLRPGFCALLISLIIDKSIFPITSGWK